MITKAKIRKLAGNAAYAKGQDLYHAHKYWDFEVEESGHFECVTATVKGSGRKQYQVALSYNVAADEVEDIHCECPAFYEYSGICKHCVAVLLEYRDYSEYMEGMDRQDGQSPYDNIYDEYGDMCEAYDGIYDEYNDMCEAYDDIYDDYDDMCDAYDDADKWLFEQIQTILGKEQGARRPADRAQRSAGSKTHSAKIKTTPIIKNLLLKQMEKRKQDILVNGVQNQVSLEPILSVRYNGIYLSFKIGITQMYVLKDVQVFCQDLDGQAHTRYGKKLEFTHTLEAFKEADRPLVRFIQHWVKYHHGDYRHDPYNAYYMPKVREMSLSIEELVDFIDIMDGRAFTGEIHGQEETVWQETREKLPRELYIDGTDEGIKLRINTLSGYRSRTQYVYFDKGKVYRIPVSELEPIQEFLSCMAGIPNRTIQIAKADVPIFCRTLLPTLEKFYVCHKQHFDPTTYGVQAARFEIYLDAPQKDWITCKALSCYGETKYNIFNASVESALRDMVGEMEIKQLIATYATSYDEKESTMNITEEEKIYELLTEGILKMQAIAEVYVSDAVKRLQVKTPPKVAVGVSVTGDLLELTMQAEDLSQEELLEFLNKYKRKQRFYRLKNGDFINVSGEDIETLIDLKENLHLTGREISEGKVAMPKYRALYLDTALKAHPSLRTSKNKAFKELIRHMKTVEDNDFEVPESLDNVLREYQKRGFLWLKTLKHNGFGGVLADDMGLGKTLQVIAFLLSEYLEAKEGEGKRTLIVCPASLVFNWKNEIEKFAPGLSVQLVIGTMAQRKQLLSQLNERSIVVTSYDLLKRDLEAYEGLTFDYQIIDEAQYIKNHNTQVAKAVKAVEAGFKVALTGTPIENKLSELWSIFDYLMPGFLYSYQRFKEEMEQPVTQENDEAAIMRLQKMIHPFVLRRLKKEVLVDLPDKIEENRTVQLGEEQQKLYNANVQKLKILLDGQSDEEFKHAKIQIFSELTKLRQICCDPGLLYEDYKAGSEKLEACMELVRNAVDGGHKVLIFSQFTSMLDILNQRLEKEGISYYTLTGATPKEKRAQMVAAFNQDDTSVFCISLKAGGTGLNLTAADMVIHYDPWWNVAVQNQATDRAHRIGQMNVVNVYKLIAKDTIEENIIKIQDLKKKLADSVLNGEGMNTGNFTKEEILELLR